MVFTVDSEVKDNLYFVIIDNQVNCLMYKEELIKHASQGEIIDDPFNFLGDLSDLNKLFFIDQYDTNYYLPLQDVNYPCVFSTGVVHYQTN